MTHHYLSPESFVLENRLSHQYWHLVGHRTELPVDNDFLLLNWADGEIVLFNDHGNIVAFDNLCPHRGTRFFVEDHGNHPAHCAYHGWRYDAGRIHIPEPQRFTPCDLAKAHLNEFRLEWCADFIFIGVAPIMTLSEQLRDTEQVLEEISFNIAGRFDFNRYAFECNWRVALENALEPYHIDMVHPNSLGTLRLGEGENTFHGLNSIWRAPVENSRIDKQLRAMSRLFNIDYQYEGYQSLYIFPYAMLSSTYGYSYSLQNFFPARDPARTHFVSRLLTAPVVPERLATAQTFFESTAQINRKVFDEDHQICKRIPTQALQSHLILADNEAKVRHFRESLASVGD
ncbi:aromatic ring-hydroxylating oxygenase subunit alpha [Pandoraea apista]|uniref:aromatic ring-hydroxylating oxygenase subunit alpha n=1 Tax=Pandoraea apista TaxID=93218 RepID=UPI0021AE0219|nr:SRPBCC family protein [Pandoraea apista]